MEQEKQLTSLPENAYRELAPGEEYTPMLPASAAPAEVTPYSVGMGIVMAIVFSAAAGLSGAQNRTGVRGGDPDRHYRRGHGQRARQAQHAGPERHHPVDRRFVGRDRRRGDLHAAGALHPGAGRGVLPDLPFVVVRRSAGHRAVDPVPQLFRQGDARQVSLPRSDGHHRGARVGREGRRAGQAARRGRCRGRTVRFSWCRLSGHGRNRFRRASAISARCAPTSSRWSSVSIPARRCWAWATSSA